MSIYWSEFSRWLECPRRWGYEYVPGGIRYFEDTPEMAEGREIEQLLGERLRNVAAFKPGRKTVIREYHSRYPEDAGRNWRIQQAFTRQHLFSVGEEELGCVADAVGSFTFGEHIRELKVTGRPRRELYQHQLLWNCWCAGLFGGELDIILRPNHERPDWAFERRQFTFSTEDFAALLNDVEAFLQARLIPARFQVRNSRACEYCPFVKNCWGRGSNEDRNIG